MNLLASRIFRPFDFDLYCTGKKFLVFNLVSRDLKIKYRRSFFGFLWTILHPLALSAVYYFVFKVVFQVQIPNYIPFVLSGVIPWTFFANTVNEGTETLLANSNLLSKVPIPTQVFPFVICLTNFTTFVLALPIVACFSLLSGVALDWTFLLLPVLCLLLFMLAHAMALLLSIAFVYLRDLRHAIGLLMQLWFYGTPVLYQEAMIPEKYKPLLLLNPIGTLFANFHRVFIGQPVVIEYLAVSAIWALIMMTVAILVHRHFARTVVERL